MLKHKRALLTHVLQSDDVGMLAIAQEDFHLVRRIPFGFVDDLGTKKEKKYTRLWCNYQRRERKVPAEASGHLDGVLHARAFLNAALADGVRADADVLPHLVRVAELSRVPVKLLR